MFEFVCKCVFCICTVIDITALVAVIACAFGLLVILIDVCKRTRIKGDERSLLVFALFSVLLLIVIYVFHVCCQCFVFCE